MGRVDNLVEMGITEAWKVNFPTKFCFFSFFTPNVIHRKKRVMAKT